MTIIRGDFTKVSTATHCAKLFCSKRPIYRHHRGDEHRFIRYLSDHKRKRWVRDLTKRYHAFREEDIVRICGDHHEEIHEYLYAALKHFAQSKALFIPIDQWPEAQVHTAIDYLRTSTALWLTQTTVGVKTRLLTTYP